MSGETATSRFWAKVDKSGACWLWTAGKTAQGYGGFHPVKGQTVLAHRYAYELLVGPIPTGRVIDHLCRRRECVKPTHLEAVTNLENLRRGAGYALRNGLRTACVNGHQYTPENTYQDPAGGVRCRECARALDRQPHRLSSIRRNKQRSAA